MMIAMASNRESCEKYLIFFRERLQILLAFAARQQKMLTHSNLFRMEKFNLIFSVCFSFFIFIFIYLNILYNFNENIILRIIVNQTKFVCGAHSHSHSVYNIYRIYDNKYFFFRFCV